RSTSARTPASPGARSRASSARFAPRPGFRRDALAGAYHSERGRGARARVDRLGAGGRRRTAAGRGRGDVQSSPLGGQLTARGYAWAASGYRAHGYRPDWFLADTLALRDHVIKELGQPRWTIIHGQSMGGHVAIASLELYPEVYQGGLIERGGGDG